MKPPRLQFSLRMLLVLMVIIGAGLTIFRWQWVESDLSTMVLGSEANGETPRTHTFERRTTLRRNSSGQPVKHGVEQTLRDGKIWQETTYYDGQQQGMRRAWDPQGKNPIEWKFETDQRPTK